MTRSRWRMAFASTDRRRSAAAALIALAAALGVAGCGGDDGERRVVAAERASEVAYLRERAGLPDLVVHPRVRKPVVRHGRTTAPLAFSFTADGRRAIVLEAGNTASSLIAVEDGRRRELATFTPPTYYTVAVAPDGSQLATVHAEGGHEVVIDLLDSRGAPLRRVATGVDLGSRIAWSADGATLAYAHRDGHHGSSHVRLVDVATGTQETFGDRLVGRDPTLAPDGSLAFERRGRIVVRPAGGGPLRRVTGGPGRDGRPAFSPDGRQIAYQHQPRCPRRQPCWTDIFIVSVDGGDPRNLTRTPRRTEHFPGWRPAR
jgi:dipeptidyl aminopeptidase/acylaminoacyl peptidase